MNKMDFGGYMAILMAVPAALFMFMGEYQVGATFWIAAAIFCVVNRLDKLRN